MKDFTSVSEFGDKRNAVINTIRPICDAYGIVDYDYVMQQTEIDGLKRTCREYLRIGPLKIETLGDSVNAIVQELTAYIFDGVVRANGYSTWYERNIVMPRYE